MNLHAILESFGLVRKEPPPVVPLVVPRASAITVKDIREENPEFRREYSATLSERASIKVTMRNAWAVVGTRRDASGELTQPNGRWVLFDPERVADRIIDRDLVTLVERCVAQIYELDRQFMATERLRFVDKSGAVWERKP